MMIEHINWIEFARLSAIPLIGAFIGWLTNYIAIKMLFYPRQPKKILFLTFHGIFPKNKSRIATKLGNVVQRDLINFNDIKERLKDSDSINNVNEEIALRVDEALRNRLGKMGISNVVPEQIITAIHKVIVREIHKNLPTLIDTTISKVEGKLNIQEIVYNKVQNFSDEKLEQLLMDITAREFKFIEIIGGVLGFLIGIIQLLIGGIL
ncbi:MAG: DUF445 family protein [Chitinophagales bacterium]|nr:DUF445 family protein [Chitinophagales bacterium]MCZ2393156.1 DUF445 family protein [Chitinophagales bacterium]